MTRKVVEAIKKDIKKRDAQKNAVRKNRRVG